MKWCTSTICQQIITLSHLKYGIKIRIIKKTESVCGDIKTKKGQEQD